MISSGSRQGSYARTSPPLQRRRLRLSDHGAPFALIEPAPYAGHDALRGPVNEAKGVEGGLDDAVVGGDMSVLRAGARHGRRKRGEKYVRGVWPGGIYKQWEIPFRVSTHACVVTPSGLASSCRAHPALTARSGNFVFGSIYIQ